ncbi:integral membrane protein PTH11 [Fusarium napiforme]|uniref:Integral membrane protein PTH11 n=1 Tax=Fusarium napiforme TaxID=42672 RepID=A0A8H5NBU8_9HYPO|nr:integral membrane protein PTH11 [Fusarium napiforme]
MDFNHKLLVESWVLWVLGLFVVVCRLISRRMKLRKWSRLAIEDYLMIFALINFTGVVVSINEVSKNGSNYMPADVAAKLTPEGRQQAIIGSKMTFVLEIFALTLTYIVVTFMFVFFWCSPTPEYWSVPVNPKKMQCATYYNHMIFATACNIASDIMLILLPIPIVINISLPKKRKIGLCCVFGLGLFNILAAVLNRYYNFSNPNSYVFLYWYVAEGGVALWVGNLPLCWPVLRLALGSKGDSTDPSSYPNTPYRNGSYPEGSARRRTQGLHPLSGKPSIWSKLEDEDGVRTDVSPEQGSQIELVDQHGPDLLQRPYRAEAKISSGTQQHERARSGQITVVTSVDVTSKQT